MASRFDWRPVPRPATPLIGRERELALVRDLLLERHARLVTLVGPGGVGKTRLALQLARELGDAFPGRVALVTLAPIGDPRLVIPAVCRAVGVAEGDEQSLADRLDGERELPMLLVLDNFEHLLPAAPALSRLLAGVSTLTVLVTSRAVLGLAGEHVFGVHPLALPATGAPPGLGHLHDIAAVRLFSERALAATRDFSFTAETAPTVVAICRRLEGLPLAIELAATCLRVLSPTELLARLEKRLTLPGARPGDLPDRQRTIRNTIAWSVNLLPPGVLSLFRRLAVFSGGWTLPAAEAIAGDADGEVFDGVSRLLDFSLVMRTVTAEGESRFSMLEVVREYALELLVASGELDLLRRSHLAFFVALAEDAAPELGGPKQDHWLDRLEAEHPNLRLAIAFGLEDDGAAALRLAAALGRFWEVHGHIREGRRWLDDVLRSPAGPAAAIRAKALQAAGTLARTAGDYGEASRLLQASLAFEEDGAGASPDGRAGAARTWFELAQVAHYLADFEAVSTACQRSLALYEALADRRGIATAKGMLGHAAWHLKDFARGRASITESLGVWRELGDALSVSWGQWDLGNISRDEGRVEESRGHFAEGLVGASRAGDMQLISALLDAFGSLAILDRRPDRAAEMLGAAAEVRRAHGITVPPSYERDVYLPLLATLKSALSGDEVASAWSTGAALGVDEAVGLALGGRGVSAAAAPSPAAAVALSGDAGRVEIAALTKREVDVLRLLARGRSNQEIAEELVISLNTVFRHVGSILAKTGAANRTEAAVLALRNGLGPD